VGGRLVVMSNFIYTAVTTLQSLDMDVIVDPFRLHGEGNRDSMRSGLASQAAQTLFPMAQEG